MPKLNLALPKLSLKQRQWLIAIAGGAAVLGLVMFVSSLLGGSGPSGGAAPPQLPPAKNLTTTPGQALSDREAWMGGAGRDVAEIKKRQEEIERENQQLRSQMKALLERPTPSAPSQPTQEASPSPTAPSAPAAGSTVRNQPFPAQPTPTPRWQMPPGTPGNAPVDARRVATDGAATTAPGSGMVRVSLREARLPGGARGGDAPADKSAPNLSNFLPINFTPARLLGGMLAPTGGQAQSNPIPALIEVTDLSVLPNDFRADVARAFVTAEGYGDIASERVYLRLLRLSYILRDGRVGEDKVEGVVYGPDGMLGVRGNLVQKQGQLLANALLSGVAAGIGQAFAQSATVTSVSPLGATQTIDTNKIAQAGLGQGVGNAMNRLADYYISLAEQIHPVVEIYGDQKIDLVFTRGAKLTLPIPTAAVGSARPRAGNERAAFLSGQINLDD